MSSPAAHSGITGGRREPTNWILLLLFTILALVTVLRHEMWRDEMHAWQAVASAGSPLELIENVRTEGHPGLWFALLYPVTRATTNPVAMQLVHLAIAVGTAAVVLFLSPFSWGWRALIVFGYFPLYEYCAISRNYGIGALLLVVFCAGYPSRADRPLLLAGVLFLLAQSSVYALIMSFACGIMWIAEAWSSRRAVPIAPNRAVASLSLWLFGILLSLVQLVRARPAMHPLDPEKITETNRVLDVLATPWRGYVPLPSFRFHFWNTNILDDFAGSEPFQVMSGLALVVFFTFLFVRRKPVLLLYWVGTAGLVAFSFAIYVGHLRHHGHHLMLLLACLWIQQAGRRTADRSSNGGGIPRWGSMMVGGLLVVNTVAGAYAVARDWRDPFSAGREVAEYISSDGLAGLPVVGHRDVFVAAVAGYLQRSVYYPSLGREASFIRWGDTMWFGVDDEETVRQAGELAVERQSDVIIVFNRSGQKRPDTIGGAEKIREFSTSIVRRERFELFRLSLPDS